MRPTRLTLAATAAALTVSALAAPAVTSAANAGPAARKVAKKNAKPAELRIATFNASLNRNNAGDLVRDLSTAANAQASAIAETIQRTRPEPVLKNPCVAPTPANTTSPARMTCVFPPSSASISPSRTWANRR